MLGLEGSGRPAPDVEAREVSPKLDLDIDIAITNTYLVLDFVRVNLLGADDTSLSRPVSGPHLMWRRNKDSALEPPAYGEEERPITIIVFGAA